MSILLLLLLAVNDHAAVTLKPLPELKVFLLFSEKLLVALKQLLSQLDNFVACHCNLFLHVRDEQVLIKLVNV